VQKVIDNRWSKCRYSVVGAVIVVVVIAGKVMGTLWVWEITAMPVCSKVVIGGGRRGKSRSKCR
jgi:hypothetical protein